MTNITQDEHGTITISTPDGVAMAHMSPEVFDVLSRQEPLEPRRVYGDLEPVTLTPDQIAYMIQGGHNKGWPGTAVPPQPAETKLRFKGGLWRDLPPASLKVTTRNQRKRWRRRMAQ